jgi:hypothetical protein
VLPYRLIALAAFIAVFGGITDLGARLIGAQSGLKPR